MVSPGSYCATPIDTSVRPIERADRMSSAADVARAGRSASPRTRQRGVVAGSGRTPRRRTFRNIRRTQSVLHKLRECPQDVIAVKWSNSIVIALEEIEVDQVISRAVSPVGIAPLFRFFHGDEQSTTV
jgi:hypothetical protein